MPILGSPLVHGPFDLKDKKNMGQMVYQTVGHLWSRKHVFYLLGITLHGGGGARIFNGSYPTVRKKNVMPDTVPSVERMRIY